MSFILFKKQVLTKKTPMWDKGTLLGVDGSPAFGRTPFTAEISAVLIPPPFGEGFLFAL